MSEKEIQIPEVNFTKLQSISKDKNIDLEELKEEYLFRCKTLIDKYAQNKIELVEPAMHRQAIMIIWKDYVARPPLHSFKIIPIGFSVAKKSKSKILTSMLYAAIQGEKGIQRITCQDTMADKVVQSVNLFDSYDVKLGRFSKGGGFIADDRTRFGDPKRLNCSPMSLLRKLDIPRFKIAEAGEYVSHVGSDGYSDSCDWRCVKGLISRIWTRDRVEEERDDDGKIVREYEDANATIRLADDSILDREATVDEKGNVLTPGFTCWVAPEMCTFSLDDEVLAFGNVSYYKKGEEYQMNAYLLLPSYEDDVKEG